MGRARSNAMSLPSSQVVKLSQAESTALLKAQTEGLQRGINVLSKLTVDWEDLLWKAAGSVAAMTSSMDGMDYGTTQPPEGPRYEASVSDFVVDKAPEVATSIGEAAPAKLRNFFSKIYEKVKDKIESNIWVQRIFRLLGLGMNFLLGFIKKTLTSKEVIGGVMPFYSTIKGAIDGVRGAIAWHKVRSSIETLESCESLIGGGVPSVAMSAFQRFLIVEEVKTGAKTLYTFGKTIASTILQVVSMGASKVFDLVTSITEVVVTFIHNMIQAGIFYWYTRKARQWAKTGDIPPHRFATIINSCPLLGCFFFGIGNYIGHFNLSALLADPSIIITPGQLTESITKISEVQRVACGYIKELNFKPKFHSSDAEKTHGWLLKMIEGFANDSPKTEIWTDNASRLDKAWYDVKKAGSKLGSLIGKMF